MNRKIWLSRNMVNLFQLYVCYLCSSLYTTLLGMLYKSGAALAYSPSNDGTETSSVAPHSYVAISKRCSVVHPYAG